MAPSPPLPGALTCRRGLRRTTLGIATLRSNDAMKLTSGLRRLASLAIV